MKRAILVLAIILLPFKLKAEPPSNFKGLLKDMHIQIMKWEDQLEQMKANPKMPLVEKGVIETLIKLLEQIDAAIRRFLPQEPTVKKIHTLYKNFKQMPCFLFS